MFLSHSLCTLEEMRAQGVDHFGIPFRVLVDEKHAKMSLVSMFLSHSLYTFCFLRAHNGRMLGVETHVGRVSGENLPPRLWIRGTCKTKRKTTLEVLASTNPLTLLSSHDCLTLNIRHQYTR